MRVDAELNHHGHSNQRCTARDDTDKTGEKENRDEDQQFAGGHVAILAMLVGFISDMVILDLEIQKVVDRVQSIVIFC